MTQTPGFETTVAVYGDTTPSDPLGERRPELERGTVVGRYQIIRLLGRGGMGAVYAALDTKLDRQIALKLLHSAHGPDAADRLIREAQALARLDDAHVVQVYDAGEYDGHVFVAMQLVDGEDLATALTRKRTSVAQILSWFCAAGHGLAAAHAVGLVHRDFKPNNVLIDRRGRVAVTDFGLARSSDGGPTGRPLTSLGTLMGTPAFMSPEQHAQLTATPASDQFSFCVALWEALYDCHPFIAGDRTTIGRMSPFAIGYAIYDGELLPPPKHRRVPRRVHEALVRGLAHAPAQRWPSMQQLLAEIEPPRSRRVWPILAGAGALAAIAGGAGVWFLAARSHEPPPACALVTAQRVNAVWSTPQAQQLQARFAKSGRSYAEMAAQHARAGLDKYAMRWQQMAADVCEAERAAHGALPELVVRRRGCLDAKLDALRGLATMLTTEDRPEFVDRAQPLVDGLPDLGDCVDESAPNTPPPAIVAEVTKLDGELNQAESRAIAGDYSHARDEATRILGLADQLRWPPLQARGHFVLGRVAAAMMLPARDELVKAAEIANAHHLDRDAARAWAWAQQAAGWEQSVDGVAMLAPIAHSSAERTNDKLLIAMAELKHARALLRLRKWKDGAAECKTAYDKVQTLDKRSAIDEARDCMLESLVPLGARDDVEKLLAQIIADKTKELGADHPTISDYLKVRVGLRLRTGKIAEARHDAEQVLAIRKRTYPPEHYKIAEALDEVGDVADAEGKPAEADKLFREALDMLDENKPELLVLRTKLSVSIAIREFTTGKKAEGLARFDEAAKLVRKHSGDNALELAVLLLNYGQFKARENVEAGLGLIGEAREILERNKDHRAVTAGTAAAIVAYNAKRWPDVIRFCDDTLPLFTPNDDPEAVATTKSLLAQALVETKGDTKRAKQLAQQARVIFVKLGPSLASEVKTLDKLLAKLR